MDIVELVEDELILRPYQCDWQTCNKSFNRKSDLQRHYRIHIGERPYSCMTPGCGKNFIQSSALKVHIRTHTGERPYQCQHMSCTKRFSDSSSLARHRRVHTGKRPYKCSHEGCSKSFCRKITAIRHERHSHQHSNISDSDADSSASQQQSHQLPPNIIVSSRSIMPIRHQTHLAHSHADFGEYQLDGIPQPESYSQRQSLPVYDPSCNSSFPEYNQSVNRIPSLPDYSSYYVSEQYNPGVATFHMGPRPFQICHIPCDQHLREVLRSNPRNYSPVSKVSPVPDESYYVQQTTIYPVQNSPSVEQPPIVHFQQSACCMTLQQY